MANMHLVTGYAGQEHVTAADHGAFNAALIGTGQFVLEKGKVFEVQVISNNQIRVFDGELMMHGRFVRLNPDTYVDLTIENGTQAMLRNDLIVARYTKDTNTGVEAVNLVVIKGEPAESNPVDPEHTEGDVAGGTATLNDFPLWRIPLDGLNVGEPVSLFGEPFMDSMLTLPEIRQQVNDIMDDVDEKIAGIDSYLKTEVLTDTTKTMFGLGTDAVPNDAFAKLSGLYLHNWRRRTYSHTPERYEVGEAVEQFIPIGINAVATLYFDVGTSVSVDTTGTLTLGGVNRPQVNVSSVDTMNTRQVFVGKYFKDEFFGKVYYCSNSAVVTGVNQTRVINGTTWYGFTITECSLITGYAAITELGEWEYLVSTDRNAHPDSDVVGGYEYQYVGVPFENTTSPVKIATGSYIGTGTSGVENPNVLTFDFVPKLVMCHFSATIWFIWFEGITDYTGSLAANSSYGQSKPTAEGTTFSWYGSSADNQLNASGNTYHYIAIG